MTPISSQNRVTNHPAQQPQAIYGLFFCIMKVMVVHNHVSLAFTQEQIKSLDEEYRHFKEQGNVEEITKHKAEKSSTNWSTAMHVFSWMTSFTQILAGCFMMASGNVVSGALLIAGGTIQLTSQIMQMTGGWDKVGDAIPAESTNEKRSIVTWMQVSIGGLSLMLGGAGGIFAGKAAFMEGTGMGNILMGSVAAIGMGICSIGAGIASKELYDAKSRVEFYSLKAEENRMERKDLMESSEGAVERMEKDHEAIGFCFQLIEQDNKATQRILGG